MTIEGDAEKLLAHMDSLGIDASTERTRGWQSIGAIIVDAALQRRQKLCKNRKTQSAALVAAWPDADTTTGLRRRLDSGELSETISWPTPGRLTQIDHITKVLERPDIAIDTVHQLRDHPAKRIELRTALRAVLHVGPKTHDYFDILSGIPTGLRSTYGFAGWRKRPASTTSPTTTLPPLYAKQRDAEAGVPATWTEPFGASEHPSLISHGMQDESTRQLRQMLHEFHKGDCHPQPCLVELATIPSADRNSRSYLSGL